MPTVMRIGWLSAGCSMTVGPLEGPGGFVPQPGPGGQPGQGGPSLESKPSSSVSVDGRSLSVAGVVGVGIVGGTVSSVGCTGCSGVRGFTSSVTRGFTVG